MAAMDQKYIGIIQNFDNQFVSMYVLQENHSNQAKLDFLKCGDLWWWESNRSIPINLFLKQEFSQFKPWLKTFARKEVTVVEGPTVSMLDLINRKIKIIADTYVDKAFGSGVVKITPAHDFNDYKIGKTHKLEFINILTKKAELNENAGPYAGMKVIDARKKVIEDLKALNLFVKEEPHIHSVGHCSRSGAVVEPFLSEQWFMKMENLATPAKRVVESGTIRFEPESWTKVYLHWMNIIEDWCISRQLWWGHRIPAWHCEDCDKHTVSESTPTECEHCHSKK